MTTPLTTSFLETDRETTAVNYPTDIETLGIVRSQGIYAGPGSDGTPVPLLLASAGGVRVESRDDVEFIMGTDASALLYDVTRTNYLKLGVSGAASAITAPTKLVLETADTANTVRVGDVQYKTSGSGADAVTSVTSAVGGTLRLDGPVTFERATLSKTESNIVDGDFFAHSMQLWKEVPPTRLDASTGAMGYAANDANMVGFQLVINDSDQLELNKYTRFSGAEGEPNTHVTKLAGRFGVLDLTHDLASTTDNAHFASTFQSSAGVPTIETTNDIWRYALTDTGVWVDKKVGIGINDPQHLLHVVGDEAVGDKIVTNLPFETTSSVQAQVILTESDVRIKSDIEDVDKAESVRVISELKPRKFTQLTGDKRQIDGFVAQEVFATIPAAVVVKPSNQHALDDFHYLETMPLISHLVNVVQTLSARIAALEAASDNPPVPDPSPPPT